jgi:hypothetical protein
MSRDLATYQPSASRPGHPTLLQGKGHMQVGTSRAPEAGLQKIQLPARHCFQNAYQPALCFKRRCARPRRPPPVRPSERPISDCTRLSVVLRKVSQKGACPAALRRPQQLPTRPHTRWAQSAAGPNKPRANADPTVLWKCSPVAAGRDPAGRSLAHQVACQRFGAARRYGTVTRKGARPLPHLTAYL